MTKALLCIGLTFVAFVAGLAGAFIAVPSVDPEQAEAVRARIDSLRVARAGLAADTTAAPPMEAPMVLTADSAHVALAADSSAADSSAACFFPVSDALIVALRDSLDGVRHAEVAYLRRADSLHAEIDSLRQRQKRLAASQAAHRADLAALSQTVTRLEDGELAALLERLDAASLSALYEQASARSRTRLLQALPPSEAARLVSRLVDPAAAVPAVPAVPVADTLATTAALEPGVLNR